MTHRLTAALSATDNDPNPFHYQNHDDRSHYDPELQRQRLRAELQLQPIEGHRPEDWKHSSGGADGLAEAAACVGGVLLRPRKQQRRGGVVPQLSQTLGRG